MASIDHFDWASRLPRLREIGPQLVVIPAQN
jgi:hypothetical protein